MPYRTGLFIDKLCLTFHIEQAHKSSVIRDLEYEANLGIIERVTRWSSELLKIYRRAYNLRIGENSIATIQVEPHHDASIDPMHSITVRRRFMRIEWNPNQPGANQEVFSLLERCIPLFSFEWFFEIANITRLDLTFDVFGVHIDSIEVISTLRKMQTVSRRVPQGRLNAIEFGKPKGDKYLLVYDKRLERSFRPATTMRNGRRYIRRLGHVTRFELRLRDLGTFGHLADRRNPFANYTVRSVTPLAIDLPNHYRSWLGDAVLRRGLAGALSLIENRRERARYVKAFREAAPPTWWQPDLLWAELPRAIESMFA